MKDCDFSHRPCLFIGSLPLGGVMAWAALWRIQVKELKPPANHQGSGPGCWSSRLSQAWHLDCERPWKRKPGIPMHRNWDNKCSLLHLRSLVMQQRITYTSSFLLINTFMVFWGSQATPISVIGQKDSQDSREGLYLQLKFITAEDTEQSSRKGAFIG